MDAIGSGCESWPLQAGGVDNPTLTAGGSTTWQLNTVPDRCPTGPLAYLLPCVTLTISGSVVQPATSGSIIFWDQLVACLVASIDWTTSWYGTVMSGNHVKGSDLNIIETISGGLQKGLYPRPPIAAASGTYPFEMTINLPANSCKFGKLLRHTSQLAKCFQTSNLKLTMPTLAAGLQSFSTGATFGTLTAFASAQLVPTAELMLGTPIEWILQQPTASANSNQITIKGFGTDTMITGVLPQGGVLWLGELSSLNGQNGVLTGDQITQYAFPWRGQQITKHPQAVLSSMINGMTQGRPSVFPAVVAGGDSQFASYPYANSTSDQMTASGAAALMDLKGLLAWIMVQPQADAYLTDLQTALNDQNYFANANGGFAAGSHQILGAYAKVWSQPMVQNWQALITDGGTGSLAAYVLNGQGGDYTKAQLNKVSPRGMTTADQSTYLPYIFA